jgi:hypothetical protein
MAEPPSSSTATRLALLSRIAFWIASTQQK